MLMDCTRCGLIDWNGNEDAIGRPCCPCCGRCVHIDTEDDDE